MKALEKAQKKYWYGQGFNKWDSGCVANTELCVFAEGWKAALEWVLTNKKPIQYNAYKFDYIKTDIIEEELEGDRK